MDRSQLPMSNIGNHLLPSNNHSLLVQKKKNQLTPLAIIWENTVSVLRRKFSSTGGKAPRYRLSPDHFQTVKQMLAPDWAQKMLCIIVPNRQTASPEFFSWVRTWPLLTQSQLVWLMHQRIARSLETFSLI